MHKKNYEQNCMYNKNNKLPVVEKFEFVTLGPTVSHPGLIQESRPNRC